MAIQKKLLHFKQFSDFNSKKLSANEANTQYTVGVGGEIQSGSPDILYQSIVWIKDTKQQWTHGQLYSGEGSAGVYITDFTVNDLENAIVSNSNVVADLTSLEEAFAAHKVVLVPYDAGLEFSGYGILVGYAEDLLYFSVYSGGYGSVFYEIEETRNNTYIEYHSISKRTWNDKQDKLVSGTNIKTINRQSLLDSGDICVAEVDKTSGVDCVRADMLYAYESDGLYYALPGAASGNEDDIIATKNTLKTINGQSLLGSGDIVIEGGETLTESDIAAMGFTKNTGTYSKPSGGIPKTDLASAVQTSLGKADTALQAVPSGYATETYVNNAIASAITTTLNTAV